MPTIEVLLDGLPVGTDQGRLALATVALIRGRNNILVDVGHFGRREVLEQALEDHGLAPDDIQMVVLSHAHWDHAQNVDMFPNARILIHPKELEYSRAPRKGDWATPRYFAATLQGLEVQEVVEGTELEPGVRIIETPGHTRGHTSVAVDAPAWTASSTRSPRESPSIRTSTICRRTRPHGFPRSPAPWMRPSAPWSRTTSSCSEGTCSPRTSSRRGSTTSASTRSIRCVCAPIRGSSTSTGTHNARAAAVPRDPVYSDSVGEAITACDN